jgi:hypothetical protein
MYRDLENAQAFLREAQSKENAQNYSEANQASISEPPPSERSGAGSEPVFPEEVASPAVPSPHRGQTFRTRLVYAGALILIGLVVVSFLRFKSRPNPVDRSQISNMSNLSRPIEGISAGKPAPLLLTASEELAFASAPLAPVAPPNRLTADPPLSLVTPPTQPADPLKESPASPEPPPPIVSPARRAAAKLPDHAVAARADGTLAISSPASIDIYKDDTYIGSAPVSLELPAGLQTLEYRHGSLIKRVTHLINSNETTRAMITFDVDVQINSKPWAEVFLDGVERKDLGQTPLSGVRVPIGSVLVFENPGFPKKKYRVTGNETGIQIVFP